MAEASDFEELRRLERDLGRAADGIAPQVQGVMKNGAGKIKSQMRSEMAASPHFKAAARSIDYDVKAERDAIEIEIGPDKSMGGGEGALANIAYFGTPKGGGGVPDPQLALDAESPVIERFLEEILGGAL